MADPFFPKFVITSEEPDREKDITRTAGLNWDTYAKNPVVFVNHIKEMPPIALCRDPATGTLAVEVEAHKAIGGAHFHGETEESRQVEKLVRLEILAGASLGFLAKKSRPRPGGGRYIDKAEVVEWSICPVPVCAACTRQKMLAADCRSEVILKAVGGGDCRCGGKTLCLDRAYLFPEKDFTMCQTVTPPPAPEGLELAKLFIPKADTGTLSGAIHKAEALGFDLAKANAAHDDGGYSLRWLGVGELEPGTMQRKELADGVTATYGKKALAKVDPPEPPKPPAPEPLTVKSLAYRPATDDFALTLSAGEPLAVKAADVAGLAGMPVTKAMLHPAHRHRLYDIRKAVGESGLFLHEHSQHGNLSMTQQAACRSHRDGLKTCYKALGEMEEATDDEKPIGEIHKSEGTATLTNCKIDLTPAQQQEIGDLKKQIEALTANTRLALGQPAA